MSFIKELQDMADRLGKDGYPTATIERAVGRTAVMEAQIVADNKRITELETELKWSKRLEEKAIENEAKAVARIAELEAQIESRVTSKAKGWLQVNLELKVDNERLREYYEAAEDVMDELDVGYGEGFAGRLGRLNDAKAALGEQ